MVALLKKVGEYAGRMDMITVPFTEIQEQIRDNCPEELATVIMRRFMMRAAERIARERECSALVTGESLGRWQARRYRPSPARTPRRICRFSVRLSAATSRKS